MLDYQECCPPTPLVTAVPCLLHACRRPMSNLETRMTLLVRIRDAKDRNAWNDFFQLYAPLVYSYASKHGFQDADAADIAQDVMCTVAKAIDSFDYDRNKGSFRGWLVTIARNCIRKRWDRDRRNAAITGVASVLETQLQNPSEESLSQWDREYALRVFHWAAENVRGEFRESTWKAFWLTTVEGRSIESTGELLGISVGAIYVARSRVLARIKGAVAEFDSWGGHR